MKARPAFVPDILRGVLASADRVTDDPWLHWKVVKEAMRTLSEADTDHSPAELTWVAQRAAARVLGQSDPWAADRERMNLDALAVEDEARGLIQGHRDGLEAALLLAALASGMDPVARCSRTAKDVVAAFGSAGFAMGDLDEFRADLDASKSLLYVLDNAGEALFDKLLMEQIGTGRRITAVVRRSPVLAAATVDDARAVGLATQVALVSPGCDAIGCPLESCSSEFKDSLAEVDMLLGKGEASYQTLHGATKRAWFLLSCRSPVMGAQLGIKEGELALVRE